MFKSSDILFEDNHILIVNKPVGKSVQADNSGDIPLEDEVKGFIKKRDKKEGNVFLGVIHRIDKPVSGAVVFAKTGKALRRLNEMVKNQEIKKTYWAIVTKQPQEESGVLTHYILKDSEKNRSFAYDKEKKGSKLSKLSYELICMSDNFYLLEVDLITGRHHQIRAQLSKAGMPIKGDLKYGAARSNKGGGISLHARKVEFVHPVTKETITVAAPVPQDDNLWTYFESCLR